MEGVRGSAGESPPTAHPALHPASDGVFFSAAAAARLPAALHDLRALLDSVSAAVPDSVRADVATFLGRAAMPAPPDVRAVASAAADAWIGILGGTSSCAFNQAPPSPSDELGEHPTLPVGAPWTSTSEASARRGAQREVAAGVRAAHGYGPKSTRPHALDTQGMWAGSPYAPQPGRAGSKADFETDRVFGALLERERRKYENPLGVSEARVPTDAATVPQEWLDSSAAYRAAAGKPPREAAPFLSPRFDAAAIRREHLLANADELCWPCEQRVCATGTTFSVVALAAGPPLPFAPGERARVTPSRPSMYAVAPEDARCATNELTDLLWSSKGHRVPVGSSTNTHPVFVVHKLRFAPPAAKLAALAALPVDERVRRLEAQARVIFDDAQRGSTPADRATGAISASAMAQSLAAHVTDDKRRLVFDAARGGLNAALVSWPFSYMSVAEIMADVQPNAWGASLDISSAFHLLSSHPSDAPRMGVVWPLDPERTPPGPNLSPAELIEICLDVVFCESWRRACDVRVAAYARDLRPTQSASSRPRRSSAPSVVSSSTSSAAAPAATASPATSSSAS